MANQDSLIRTREEAPPQGGVFLRWLVYVESSMNALGTVWIFALVILINIDAFGRTLFAAPIDGVPEMLEFSIVGIVFLQLADATRKGRLTRSDSLFQRIMINWPRVGHVMGAVFNLLGAFFMFLILWGSLPLFLESIEKDFYIGVEGIFTAPVWPVKLIILLGASATLIQLVVFSLRHLRSGGESKPTF